MPPLLQLPAKTTPSARTRASRLVVDAALRVRSSRHVPASRRPDHRTDATRCARAAPHVGRRRVACVVAARLLFRPDVRREHAVEVPVPARAPHSINLREPRLGGVSAWQDRPAAPHAACARSAWHTQGQSRTLSLSMTLSLRLSLRLPQVLTTLGRDLRGRRRRKCLAARAGALARADDDR